MSLTKFLGNLLGLDEAQRIEGWDASLGASWAQGAAVWLFFGCLIIAALAIFFYRRCQPAKGRAATYALVALRTTSLCILLILLAEPSLMLTVTSRLRPALWLLVDGSQSMAIRDELPQAERMKLDAAVEMPPAKPAAAGAEEVVQGPSRLDYVKAFLEKDQGAMLKRLAKDYRLKTFVFDNADGVRSVDMASADGGQEIDPARLAQQLSEGGEVTAMGNALSDLARRHATSNLAGLVVLSDFDQNSGVSPLATAKDLDAKIYTVGVGAASTVDLAVAVQAPPHVKKDERAGVQVTVRQQGLDGQTVVVSLAAARLGGEEGQPTESVPLGDKELTLVGASQEVEFPYLPDEAGRFLLVASVEAAPGEVVVENNRAQREITVLEDFLRLLYVEYEPTWEWRFIKEVFHRDKLVGMEGFHTFLRSSDARVRQTGGMFLPTVSPPRSVFFANDVIFLGDLPASSLSPRFCQMTDEFVRNFGGGLVVMAGPRFGPAQLADTVLGNLLPVKFDAGVKLNDRQPFRLKLSPRAEQYGFMRLAGETATDNQKAWDNLGQLPWYYPVERLHPMAVSLADHPTAKCADGKTPQPLIAVRRVGRGEVIYVGFNEMWRLRRLYGEKYYRAFWGQLIHRLGLSHELGAQKRFAVHTDRRRYQPDEEVSATIEAFSAEFEPLEEKDLAEGRLRAELILPERAAARGDNVQTLTASQLRSGVFETRFSVFAAGEYRLRVFDPIVEKWVESTFEVASMSVERQSATRNVDLQQALADVRSGGRSYDLLTASHLPDDLRLETKLEKEIRVIPLWNTWLVFALVTVLLLGEWFLRKRVNLP